MFKGTCNNPIENVHSIQFCKDLLGVHRQTSNIGILLELGRMPITVFANLLETQKFQKGDQRET